MKRSERHHLKENALAARIVSSQMVLESRKREIMILGSVVILLAIGSGIYIGYQRAEQPFSQEALLLRIAEQKPLWRSSW